jgi:hypothetical protein
MVTYLSVVFGHLLRWLAVVAGILYAGMVLMTYFADGPYYRLSFDLRDPTRSVVNLLVWLGVKVLQVGLRFARAILNILLEASAEVGEWFMRRSPAVQESVRSRFLV